MPQRTAQCACGRVAITVACEPLLTLTCHCDFCQKRSGSVFATSAHFDGEQIVAISGETKIYNGLYVNGVGASGVEGRIDYHFCTTCGSTLYWDMVDPTTGRRVAVAVGNFVDPRFPAPTTEFFTKFRHHWMKPVSNAEQLFDPLDGSTSSDAMLTGPEEDESG